MKHLQTIGRLWMIPAFSLLALAAQGTRADTNAPARVAFEPNSDVPLVYLNLTFRAGAVDDPRDQSGLTRFMTEMLRRGSTSRSKEEIDLELDRMGARLDAEVRSEFLVLRGAVLSAQLPAFLRLLEEIALHPRFPEKEIQKLRAETLSALAEEKGRDGTLANRRFAEFLFTSADGAHHPYGHPVLGKNADVAKFTKDAIVAQYQKTITAERMTVIGSGDASTETIQTWANKLTAKLPSRPEPADRVAHPVAPSAPRLLLVDKPERTQAQVLAGQIGITMKHPDYFPLVLANQAFGGGGFSSRLMVEIRVKRGWSYGASSHFRFGLKPRSWTLSYAPAKKDLLPSLSFLIQLLEEARARGITAPEFEIAKQSLINGAGFMYNTPAKRVENAILEQMLELPKGFFESYAQKLQGVTLDKANAALRRFLDPSKTSYLVLTTVEKETDAFAKALGVSAKETKVSSYLED